MKPLCALVVTATLLPFSSGCNDESSGKLAFQSQMVPSSGVVTKEGSPLIGATVTFHVKEISRKGEVVAGETATGVTDLDGRYELMTPISGATLEEQVGAVPGEYTVTINLLLTADGLAVSAMGDMTDADAMALGAKESIPPKYSDPERSGLRATVTPTGGTNDFTLE